MHTRPLHITALGVALLGALFCLLTVAIMQLPARAASPAKIFSVVLSRAGSFVQLTPCTTSLLPTSISLTAGDTLTFLSNLPIDVQVAFTDLTHNRSQSITAPGNGGTVSLTPPAGITFTYTATRSFQTCFGRVFSTQPVIPTPVPGALPPTGGGPISPASNTLPWVWWGALLIALGLVGLVGTFLTRRRWLRQDDSARATLRR